MPRHRRAVAAICIIAIALAVCVPGAAALDYSWLEPLWLLLPDDTPADIVVLPVPVGEQLLPLLSPLASRGPPFSSLA